MRFWLSRRKGIPRLSGKLAVVTGAASGIGRALAMGLRAKGCHLALVDLDRDGLSHLQRDLAESHMSSRRDDARRRRQRPLVDAHACPRGGRGARRHPSAHQQRRHQS
ncbi:MAG: SDR family NAD(P)-dependent oxidoreductase [Gemmatimonas sp.]